MKNKNSSNNTPSKVEVFIKSAIININEDVINLQNRRNDIIYQELDDTFDKAF